MQAESKLNLNDPKAFIEYLNDMEIYKYIEKQSK